MASLHHSNYKPSDPAQLTAEVVIASEKFAGDGGRAVFVLGVPGGPAGCTGVQRVSYSSGNGSATLERAQDSEAG